MLFKIIDLKTPDTVTVQAKDVMGNIREEATYRKVNDAKED